jgi:hypothetical protein
LRYFRLSTEDNKKTKILDDDAKLSYLPRYFQMQWFLSKICCCSKEWMVCFNWKNFDKNKEKIKKLAD